MRPTRKKNARSLHRRFGRAGADNGARRDRAECQCAPWGCRLRKWPATGAMTAVPVGIGSMVCAKRSASGSISARAAWANLPLSCCRRARRCLLDEPCRQLLGQRRDRELLLVAQNRAHGAQDLSHTGRSQGRCVRLCRATVQSTATPFDAGLSQPNCVRRTGGVSLGRRPRDRQQLTRPEAGPVTSGL